MKEVTVLDFSRENIKQILTAKMPSLIKIILLGYFQMEVLFQLISIGQTTNINFKQYTYPFVEGPLDLAKVPKDASDMSLKEALEAEKIYKKIGDLKRD